MYVKENSKTLLCRAHFPPAGKLYKGFTEKLLTKVVCLIYTLLRNSTEILWNYDSLNCENIKSKRNIIKHSIEIEDHHSGFQKLFS